MRMRSSIKTERAPTEIGDKRATVETKGWTGPNQTAPMEITSQQANVVGRAYQLVEEMKDSQKAWYRIAREILEKAVGQQP